MGPRGFFRLFFLLFLFTSLPIHAQLKVTETGAQVLLGEKQLSLKLPVTQTVSETQFIFITVKLLDPDGKERACSITEVLAKPSLREITASIKDPLKNISENDQDDLFWYRLSYEIISSSREQLGSGIVPISVAHSELFRIAVAAGHYARVGHIYEVEVNAVNPVTHEPVRNVAVEGKFGWDVDSSDEEGHVLPAHALTDSSGNAHLSFNLASDITGQAALLITAAKGVISRKIDQEITLFPAKIILQDSDKPIYQPGQTLHLRSLLMDSQHKVVPQRELEVIIRDEDDTDLFHQKVTTDNFGIAHTDWSIPSNLRLGTYTIESRLPRSEDDDGSYERFLHKVQIYRYDLPNFSVAATPDRPYYLVGQDASVKIAANYLFGKPVKRAKVRVVEEQERQWNYREQKWESKEIQSQTGELNENGEFIAKMDLRSDYQDFEANTYLRFQSIDVAAYVTDLTTGRTEQRRFQIRLTREPIHVYFMDRGLYSAKMPLDAYISTFYADGTPARCTVQISAVDGDHPESTRRFMQTIKTNKYGLGKITGLQFSSEKDGRDSLLFEAKDTKGLAGKEVERWWESSAKLIKVSTPRTLYKPTEGLDVSIEGPQPDMRLLLNVIHDGEILASHRVTLHGRSGFVTFPYDPRFTGEVSIFALSLGTTDNKFDFPWGSHTVLFPKKRKLGLQVRFNKASYRPGENGSAHIAVKMPEGGVAESELGIKIVDQAVEERARTDQAFGSDSRRWSYWGYWGEADNNFGGITRDDFDNLDLTQPIPDDLDLVAEYIMNAQTRFDFPQVELSSEVRTPDEVFSRMFKGQFGDLEKAADKEVANGWVVKGFAELVAIGRANKLDVEALRDPWGTPYQYVFSYEGSQQLVTVTSVGPNKHAGDEDDFVAYKLNWGYFQYTGNLISKTIHDYFLRTGKFIRDEETLRTQLLPAGVDINTLRDPWGNPYRFSFGVDRSSFLVSVFSPGPNHIPGEKNQIQIWNYHIDYFTQIRQQVNLILNKYLQNGGKFPDSDAAFKAILKQNGVDFDFLEDPWGSRYYIAFRAIDAYSQKFVVASANSGEQRVSTPVTVVRREVVVKSPGYDKNQNTSDDFEVASYSAMESEQKAEDSASGQVSGSPAFNGNTGAIRGVVIDASGAVIAGATAIAVREGSDVEYKETSDGNGKFVLLNLPPGLYNLRITALGFQPSQFTAIPVHSLTLTELNVELRVGTTSETVTVEAEAVQTQTDSASVNSSLIIHTVPLVGKASASAAIMMSTPRLREYFPETMLWEPALLTNRSGQAQLNFKLADNITTWKLTAIASTKTGEIGTASKDLRSFQPFFIEHDPPRILTEGDEISYPVVLRNYLDKPQSVQATIKAESWFQLLSPAEQKVKIDAGEAAHATFRYRAVSSTDNGKQRITAANTEISDAIEKPLQVHPFGRPNSQTDSAVFENVATLRALVPENAIPGSLHGELKVYPSLLAHVVESVEAILERPYGCGEQTISSTYPSLLIVKFYKQRGGEAPPIVARAQRYLQAGYERLLRYQDDSGGFTYWGHGDPNIALTTYALAFLTEASQLIEVDKSVSEKAGKWLLEQQQLKDGSWKAPWQGTYGSIVETAYVTRVLVELPVKEEFKAERNAAVKRALRFLDNNRAALQDPYAIANFAIAARAAGAPDTADSLLKILRTTAHQEDTTAYWDLQTNTPFYGWGRTGRLESTALAIRALHGATEKAPESDQILIRRGLLFLMRNQDSYGIWYSGQTTINILQTLMDLTDVKSKGGASLLHIVVNGKDAGALKLPPWNEASALLRLDLGPFIKPGENRVELKGDETTPLITAQEVLNYYSPWEDAKPASSALKLHVDFSTTTAKENDTIECHVKAERVGFEGYGMMLAEIGLPPGVDVDRESLEAAMADSWSIDHYDVMPDHIVLYFWPQAGGTEFTFKFRFRFPMEAEAAPSMIYDYYNPDASVIQKPMRFVVTGNSVEDGKAVTELH